MIAILISCDAGKNKRKSKEAGGGAAVSSTDAMEMEEE